MPSLSSHGCSLAMAGSRRSNQISLAEPRGISVCWRVIYCTTRVQRGCEKVEPGKSQLEINRCFAFAVGARGSRDRNDYDGLYDIAWASLEILGGAECPGQYAARGHGGARYYGTTMYVPDDYPPCLPRSPPAAPSEGKRRGGWVSAERALTLAECYKP